MPYEWLWIVIVDFEIITDRLFERDRAAMRPAFDLSLAEQSEPTLDQIEPRAGSRSEVQMKARMACKPRLRGGRFVRTVVVHHQVDVELRRHALIDGSQELQELATAMTPMQFSDDLARGEVQRREQRGRGVS